MIPVRSGFVEVVMRIISRWCVRIRIESVSIPFRYAKCFNSDSQMFQQYFYCESSFENMHIPNRTKFERSSFSLRNDCVFLRLNESCVVPVGRVFSMIWEGTYAHWDV